MQERRPISGSFTQQEAPGFQMGLEVRGVCAPRPKNRNV